MASYGSVICAPSLWMTTGPSAALWYDEYGQSVLTSCINHVLRASTLAIPEGNKPICILSHFDIPDIPGTASMSPPICEIVLNGEATCHGITLPEGIGTPCLAADDDIARCELFITYGAE